MNETNRITELECLLAEWSNWHKQLYGLAGYSNDSLPLRTKRCLNEKKTGTVDHAGMAIPMVITAERKTMQVGSVVKLKSGGPAMTIIRWEPDTFTPGKFVCTWFSGSEIRVGSFLPASIIETHGFKFGEHHK